VLSEAEFKVCDLLASGTGAGGSGASRKKLAGFSGKRV